MAIQKSFLCKNLGNGKSEQSAKVSLQKSYFLPIRESFLPQKFPAVEVIMGAAEMLSGLPPQCFDKRLP